MGTAARERPVPLYPMCTAIEPDPAKIKTSSLCKKYKKKKQKILIKKNLQKIKK